MDDAEAAILCMGSTAGTVRTVVREMRRAGKKVGLIKLWLYRPFPAEELLVSDQELEGFSSHGYVPQLRSSLRSICSDVASALQIKKKT